MNDDDDKTMCAVKYLCFVEYLFLDMHHPHYSYVD